MIYFLQETEGTEQLIKIGYYDGRRAVRTGVLPSNGRRLSIVARLDDGGPSALAELHRLFGAWSTKNGPWFRRSPELVEFVGWAARHRSAELEEYLEYAERFATREPIPRKRTYKPYKAPSASKVDLELDIKQLPVRVPSVPKPKEAI